MKKFLVITLAAALCLALALPAMAKVTAGGRVDLDWSYLSQNDARASTFSVPINFAYPQLVTSGIAHGVPQGSIPTSNGFDNMNFVAPPTLNRVNLAYASDDGALKGFLEIRGGSAGTAEATTTGFIYAWIEWQITPNNSITFGRQTTNFARFIPNQWVGTTVTTILGVGFGNVNHTTQRTGIKGYWRMSDMVGLVWGLWTADVSDKSTGLVIATTVTGLGIQRHTENSLPRIDLALPIRFPWGRIEPSFTYAHANYDQVSTGDDGYDMYGFSLGGEGSFGMFSFVAEITYGQNLGGGSYRGAEGDVPVAYVTSTGAPQIADGSSLAWFVDVGFKFGPSKIDGMYGQITYDNDDGPGTTSLPTQIYKYTQSFYGVSWAIGVAKGFTIRPELMFYDYDSSANFFGQTIDRGKEWLLGLQFMLVF
jgi:hypothetical protein